MIDLPVRLRRWYHGKYVVGQANGCEDVLIIGGRYERHWSATAVRWVVQLHKKEWKYLLTFYVSLAGLILLA